MLKFEFMSDDCNHTDQDDEDFNVLQSVLDSYQDGITWAGLSGQLNDYFKDNHGISLHLLGHLVNTIGESIAESVVREVAKDVFDIPEEDADRWADENYSRESAAMVTTVGQQMGLHLFCIGYLTARKMAEKEAEAHA